MKHTKKLFAIIICLAMIFSSLSLVASADDVPALNDREGIVVLHEGLKFTGVYGTNKINDSWMPGYNSSYCEMPGGEALNLNSYDYIEFDYYVDSLANFTARVSDIAVEAYRTGKGVVSMSYKSKITQSGWNHIRIDIPRDADTEILKKCNQIRFVITQSASNTGSSNAYKIANITVTVDEVYFVPKFGSTDGKLVLSKNITFFGKYGQSAVDDNTLPGTSNVYTPNNAETDFTQYDYIEFDYYVKDLESLKARVSSLTFGIVHYSGGADCVNNFLDLLTKNGWNHVKYRIPKGTDRDWVIQRAKFIRFRITMPESEIAADDIYAVANICATGVEWLSIPEMQIESATLTFASGNKFSSTLGSSAISDSWLPGQSYSQIDFSRMNLRNYKYIEFDLYTENIANLKTRVSQLGVGIVHYSGGTDQVVNILDMITESGWNHIKIPMSSFATSLREWVVENAGNLRFRITMSASSVGENDHYAIANICATKDPWYNNPAMPDLEGTITLNAGSFKIGTLGSDAVSYKLPGYTLDQSMIYFDQADLTEYDYFEFDCYIENYSNFSSRVTAFEISVWNASDRNTSPETISLFAKSGWNHIKVPMSEFNQSVIETANRMAFRPNTIAGSIGANDHYAVANVCVTKIPVETVVEEPTVNIEPLILSTGNTFSGTYGSSAVSNNLLPGSNSRVKLSEETDFSIYKYVEFDYYVTNLTNLKARVTSLNLEIVHYSDGAQQVTNFLDSLTKDGWNHIKVPIITGTDNDWIIKRATRVKFRITMPASDTAASDSYIIADIRATDGSDYVAEETKEPLIIASGTKFTGTYGSSSASDTALSGTGNISLSEEVNMLEYDYIEFDYYVENLTNLKSRVSVLSFQIVHYSWAASQDTNILPYLTKNGWNHVKFPIRKQENTSVLKRAKYFRFRVTMPESSVAASETYKIADIRATYIDYSLESYDFNQSVTLGRNETEIIVTWISDTQLKSPKLILSKNNVETTFAVSERYSDYLGYYSYSGTITGVTANTDYTYRIESGALKSVDYPLSTKDFDNTFSFIQISDIQLDGTSGVNGRWLETLDRINTNFPDTSLIVNSGDVSDRSSKNEYYQAYKAPEILKSYVSSVVPGNHDAGTAGYDTYYSINFTAPNTYATHENYKINQYDYWHSYNNVLFICLNSLIGDVEYHKNFVKNVVEERGDNYDWIIVNCHYSLFSASYHSTELATIKQRSALAKLFNDLGVDMVLSGHDHIYDRAYMMNKQNPMPTDKNYASTSDGVLYISCTTGSGLKYNTQVDTSIPYSAVTSAETYGFINYEVSEGAITMTFYSSADMSVMDTFTLFKDNDEIESPEDTMEEKTDMIDGAKNITFGSNGNYTFDLSAAPKNVSADRMFETDVYVTGDTLTNITVKLTDSSGKLATYQFTGLSAGWNHLAARINDFNIASGFNKAQVNGMTLSSVAGGNIVATNCYTADYVDGDANRDGVLDVKDIVRAKKMAADPATEGNKLAVASNGTQITAVDLTTLVQSVINSLFS